LGCRTLGLAGIGNRLRGVVRFPADFFEPFVFVPLAFVPLAFVPFVLVPFVFFVACTISEYAVVWRTDIDRRRCRRYVDHAVDTTHFCSCVLRGLSDEDADRVQRLLNIKSQCGEFPAHFSQRTARIGCHPPDL